MSQQKGLIVERILRDRDGVWRQVVEERGLGRMTMSLLLTSLLSLSAYGAVLGASNSALQAASSAVKLPLLFLATLLICLPTLYLFNLIFGARLGIMQAVVLIMVCITVIAVLALAFAPISLFFLVTADDYEFFKLLNVAILVLSAFVGLTFLTAGMRRLNEYQAALAEQEFRAAAAARAATDAEAQAGAAGSERGGVAPAEVGGSGGVAVLPKAPAIATRAPTLAPEYRPASMTLLYVWSGLFGFVGTQLAWTLRPFFGNPDRPFQLFRDIEGTFYADILQTIGKLFS
jgi:hypothetical protein